MGLNKTIIIFIYLFLASTNIFFAQKNKICGEVYYKHINKISKTYIQDFLMRFDNELSYSTEINITPSENSQEIKNSDRGSTRTTIIGRKNIDPAFFYNNKKDFYFSDVFPSETLIVKEDSHKWEWNLQQETKKIGKLICQKATIKFRGRNYIAWFTNKIPVPYGPWKFKDLPGLILEVYDTDKLFHIVAYKIKVNSSEICSINFDKNQLKKAISITIYLDKEEKLINAEFAKLSSKMPKGSSPLKWNRNCEDCSKRLEMFNEKN